MSLSRLSTSIMRANFVLYDIVKIKIFYFQNNFKQIYWFHGNRSLSIKSAISVWIKCFHTIVFNSLSWTLPSSMLTVHWNCLTKISPISKNNPSAAAEVVEDLEENLLLGFPGSGTLRLLASLLNAFITDWPSGDRLSIEKSTTKDFFLDTLLRLWCLRVLNRKDVTRCSHSSS